jgi:hypothetical protein
MKQTTLLVICFVIVHAFSAQADPPFSGTIFLDPDIITEADHTTFISAPYAGRGMRTMFDRRVNAFITVNAFLFNATFDDGLKAEVQVNPEFGDSTAAGVEANKYGTVIGRLPTVSRKDVKTVWIHKGQQPFGGGNNNLLIHTEQADLYAADGILEETFVHESAHTSLDDQHANASGWLAAQSADPDFISTYARDNPTREDIAESFLPWLAVRHRRARIDDSLANTINSTIPNRLAYFDSQNFNMYPLLSASPAVLGNISTRLRVDTGDNALIGGFIITGTQSKKVMLRAIGPSLPLSGALANPVLELYSGQTLLASNDNWKDAPNKQEIIDTTIPPSNDLESAIVTTLPAGNAAYTAIVRGVNNGTGVGLVEAYDLDRNVDSKLANISTRGFVQTGDNVLIGGLIVLGQDPLKVIARAIGPSLPVAGKLLDPTLELRDGNGGLLQVNDNWRSDQEAEIIATTVPPSDDAESAIVRTLPPGNYTAIVRGVNATTGIGLVEVYALP